MEKYNCKNQIKGFIVFSIIFGSLVIALAIFFFVKISSYADMLEKHPTYHAYEDEWIIGKTVEEIEERYGEIDIDYVNYVGYKIEVYEFLGFLSVDDREFGYFIYLNENGVAEDVFVDVNLRPVSKTFMENKGKLERILLSLGFLYD